MKARMGVTTIALVFLAGYAVRVQGQEPTLEGAYVFGVQADTACETPNDPGTLYEPVEQNGADPLSVAYPDPDLQLAAGQAYPDPDRPWGYEIVYQDPGLIIVDDPDLPPAPPYNGLGNWVIYGPLDNSPNNRNRYPNTCPEEIYDSFIGCKNPLMPCDETVVGNREDPCSAVMDPDGIVFRVDVPNGFYRFVAAVGDAEGPHAHRVIVENGGEGPPLEVGPDHVVIVHNFDQSQYTIGDVAAGDRPGEGVFARVGFDDKLPPEGDGVFPDPKFINMDENGMPTTCPPNSPVLEVTEGYIRVHQLQANSNTGPGANGGQDRNGGDMVLLELWRFEAEPTIQPTPRISRSFEPATYNPGDTVTVTLEALGVAASATIEETIPPGWTVQDAGGGSLQGDTITFTLSGEESFTYTAQSPPAGCGENAFEGTLSVTGVDCKPVVSSGSQCDPGLCGVQVSGGVRNFLILGPIDAGGNTGGACDDNGNLATTDYLTDGTATEQDILVEEGDDVEPDFGGLAGGFGVGGSVNGIAGQLAPNPIINPGAAGGILTVWTAAADPTGYVDFTLAENIGNPLEDYIVYSLVYLENTTGECLDAVLEVGSDDAVKVLFNGRISRVISACRGIGAYGAGDMIPVTFAPGVNVVTLAVVQRGGGAGVRLAVRDVDGSPLIDGRIAGSCEPPGSYPPVSPVEVTRAIDPTGITTPGAGTVTVTLSASSVTDATAISDTFPPEMEIVDSGGGQVNGNTITFDVAADGDSTYTLQLTGDPQECPFTGASFTGKATTSGFCGMPISGASSLSCVTTCPATPESEEAELVSAFIFGTRDLLCPVFNEPAEDYTVVLHVDGDPLSVAYPDPDIQLALGAAYPDEDRNWGFEILYQDAAGIVVDDPDLPPPVHTARGGGWEIYGPYDESGNNRNQFADDCPEEIYDSFIGGKNWLAGQDSCSAATVGNMNDPCTEAGLDPDGLIFRVDVPNGKYRFVAALGSADNQHAHRLLAEDGGEGPPVEIGDHVVLVDNFDQAQYDIGETNGDPGDGVFAMVGFGDKIPPPGDGAPPSPQFVPMDEDGLATGGCPESPVLEVTQGYIRFHALQANANDGPGGARDPNGGDFVVLEIWSVEAGPTTGFRRGDANDDGGLNITDGIFILNFLFLGGATPPCAEASDANDDGTVNITDGIYVLNFLFLGGPGPSAPGPDACGPDPAGSVDLGCSAYTSC